MSQWFLRQDPDLFFYWFQTSGNRAWFRNQLDWINEHPAEFRYIQIEDRNHQDATAIFLFCYSQAMAVATIADQAYLFMPHDKEPLPNTVWLATELPALTQNPAVNTIYRVDPMAGVDSDSDSDSDDEPCPEKHVIWQRGINPTVAYTWECPF